MSAAEAAPARGVSLYERLVSAYPLVVGYVILLILYGWQTSRIATPWNFLDELQWAKLSYGVAHTGHPELRRHPAGFHSLYAYFLAPAWWLGPTGKAYAAMKYLNAAVMAASLFPGYALARLFVPRTSALIAGVATAAVPAAAYTGLLVPEPLAYFWSALALWLLARALLRPAPGTVLLAVAALVVAPAVRSELAVLVPAAVIATAVALAASDRGRRVIGSWAYRERIGASILIVLAICWVGALMTHHSTSWRVGTVFHHRLLTYGLWAIGAYAIGVGLVPVLVALVWALGSRLETRHDAALLGILAGVVACFATYTAVKASYLSTNFAIRVEERNLIYLSPIVFAVAARWFATGRVRLVPWALAGSAVGYLVETTPYHAYESLYSDALGLAILQWLNRTWYFTNTDLRRLLFAILAVGLAATAARELLRRRLQGGRLPRAAIALGAAIAVLVVAWNLTGEIAAANGSKRFAAGLRSVLPTPPDWIDRETGRARTMFIGQGLSGSNAFWSFEFWNQSIGDVWSVDASAPGPGPATTPNFTKLDGQVDPQLPIDWAVATPGVEMAGRVVTTVDGLRLYRLVHPIRVLDAEGGISTDGASWMEQSAWYYRFTSGSNAPGTAIVTLTRAAACNGLPAPRITLRVSSLVLSSQAQPVAGRLQAVRRVLVPTNAPGPNKGCATETVEIPARPPFRIDATANRTFQASASDLRQLSVQITFGFKP